MDLIQTAGIILAIWAVLRGIGNERECGLREIEIRIQDEGTATPPPTAATPAGRTGEQPATTPPTKPKTK